MNVNHLKLLYFKSSAAIEKLILNFIMLKVTMIIWLTADVLCCVTNPLWLFRSEQPQSGTKLIFSISPSKLDTIFADLSPVLIVLKQWW